MDVSDDVPVGDRPEVPDVSPEPDGVGVTGDPDGGGGDAGTLADDDNDIYIKKSSTICG